MLLMPFLSETNRSFFPSGETTGEPWLLWDQSVKRSMSRVATSME